MYTRVNDGGDDMMMTVVGNQVDPSLRIMAMMASWMTLRLWCLARMKRRWPMMMMRWCQGLRALWQERIGCPCGVFLCTGTLAPVYGKSNTWAHRQDRWSGGQGLMTVVNGDI